ncbi:hypothetical protein H9P43_004886 [Blastocladiella emersonii ATCC 22665]|nr:hypothetical protein H9P43_004886 [Blastocladiella emersonii ATCC 22665]
MPLSRRQFIALFCCCLAAAVLFFSPASGDKSPKGSASAPLSNNGKERGEKWVPPKGLFLDKYGRANMTVARAMVKEMFFHGWNSYLTHAWPHDELAPLTCRGIKAQGEYYLTLIDAADTLAVLGEWGSFSHAVDLISNIPHFNLNINVSLFETNIRILGGLVSTHIIADRYLPSYNGRLLKLATDIGDRLLPAFDTKTGIPYGTVNLMHGVPPNETPVVCTACATSLSLEFGYLSHLTGRPVYAAKAKEAVRALWARRSELDLVGNHIDSETGAWTATASGVAGSIDSFYEYMFKTFLVFHDSDYYQIFVDAYHAVEKWTARDGWNVLVNMYSGTTAASTFSSLQCFWAGLQVLSGDLHRANAFMQKMGSLMAVIPFLPELLQINGWTLTAHREWPQRPELIESIHAMYQATRDPGLQTFGVELAVRIDKYTRTECGFAGIQDVESLTLRDQQESFFLSETLKYLYLLFDPDNLFNQPEWVFTTEAHPLPILPNTKALRRTQPTPKLTMRTVRDPKDLTDLPDADLMMLPSAQQCSAYEWRTVSDLHSLSPPRSGTNWLRNRGVFDKVPDL